MCQVADTALDANTGAECGYFFRKEATGHGAGRMLTANATCHYECPPYIFENSVVTYQLDTSPGPDATQFYYYYLSTARDAYNNPIASAFCPYGISEGQYNPDEIEQQMP